MHRLILVVIAVQSFTSFNLYAGQTGTNKPNRVEDRVVIQRRRIVIVRGPELAKRFPERKRAVVTYPVISGLSDPVVLRRLRSLIDFKNIFDYSLKEYREDAWLSEFGYVVNFNSNYVLDITFTQSGVGAYPDEQTKHFLINLKHGGLIKALDAFQANRLPALAAMVDSKLQHELKQIEADNAPSNDDTEAAKEWSKEAHDNLKVEIVSLDDFSVGRKGITFLYDAGFPHAIKASEPQGKYFFTYAALKPYIKRDGPLGQFID